MKISLVGYGKMGHAVEHIALSRGHEIVCRVDTGEDHLIDTPEFRSADVIIEFTRPDTAIANYSRLLPLGIPVVSGTTGWTARRAEVEKMVADCGARFFWTSNFSIGVALFQRLAVTAEKLIGGYPQYRPEMMEIHHIHKLDHPSGTAVTTAEALIEASKDTKAPLDAWTEDSAKAAADPAGLLINHRREGEVPGTHIVTWTSPVDSISLEHKAFSRDGFALGAVIAAEWLPATPDPGFYSTPDLLGF